MKFIERFFEGLLWNSRFVVIFAVIASLASGFAIFYIATVDVILLVSHVTHYADSSLTAEARRLLHDETVTHIIEVVDGYLLATFMLIFSLGLYELFIGDIDQARVSPSTSSRILLIETLDDLKVRLAKVIMMILIVTLFEEAYKMKIASALELLYLGGAIALVGLALYLTHASESHVADSGKEGPKGN